MPPGTGADRLAGDSRSCESSSWETVPTPKSQGPKVFQSSRLGVSCRPPEREGGLNPHFTDKEGEAWEKVVFIH